MSWIGEQIGRLGAYIFGVQPPKATTMLITPDKLQEVTDTLSSVRSVQMCELINEVFPKYDITEKLPFRMLLANLLQESGEFAHKEENMNYSAKRLTEVWPGRFPTIEKATPYAHNPEKLSNIVYGGRMGNTQPGDGSKYKGAAFIGITGKELYQKYADYNDISIDDAAKLLKSDDKAALDASCWFFAVYKKLIPVANTGNFKAVCSLINTGSATKPAIGQNIRDKYYNRINQALG